MAANSRIIAIIGPTASGKSAVAMQLARQIGGEILSIDSMQVYRGMDVGTAKPTAPERQQVRHHLIDLVDPNQDFTVARFVEHYNTVRLHSAIGYITPADFLAGRGPAIWADRDRKLDLAREARRVRRAELHQEAA